MEIRPIANDAELDACAAIIRAAFQTVADQFGYTPESTPTLPAYIKVERVKAEVEKGVRYFGLFNGERQVGSVALEQKAGDPSTFFLERLAVLPEARHHGLGVLLMDFAFARAREAGAKKVSIAIIDENRVLKAWYERYGFLETGKKTYPHLPFTVSFMEKDVN
jgi:ribosomal protein S18 acetylase RimI-like enzyme